MQSLNPQWVYLTGVHGEYYDVVGLGFQGEFQGLRLIGLITGFWTGSVKGGARWDLGARYRALGVWVSGFIGISEWFFNRDIGASVGSNGVGRSRGLLCRVSSGLTPYA